MHHTRQASHSAQHPEKKMGLVACLRELHDVRRIGAVACHAEAADKHMPFYVRFVSAFTLMPVA